jgi:hypothetical protein
MSKNENKTKPTKANVEDFIKKDPRKDELLKIHQMMKKVTGEDGTMWGKSIIGYGLYHYKSKSGREGDWMQVGFSPRKQNITLYIMPGFERYKDLMKKLGKYSTGKSCLYIKSLEDVDFDVLTELVKESVKEMTKPMKSA